MSVFECVYACKAKREEREMLRKTALRTRGCRESKGEIKRERERKKNRSDR